jgi:hypothetical protein
MVQTTETADASETILTSVARIQELVAQLGAEYSTIIDVLRVCHKTAYQAGGLQGAREVARFSDQLPEEVAALMLSAGLEAVLHAPAREPITELVPLWTRRIAAGQLATNRRTRAD